MAMAADRVHTARPIILRDVRPGRYRECRSWSRFIERGDDMCRLRWWEGYGDVGVAFSGEFLFVVDECDLEHWAPRLSVLHCDTWGKVRELGDEIYAEVLGLAGHGEYRDLVAHFAIQGTAPGISPSPAIEAEHALNALDKLPDDDESFSARDLGACADGDWPPSIYYLVAEAVPSEVLEAYGETWETNFNGTYGILDATQREVAFAALEAAGYALEEDARIGDFLAP